jgi:ATP-binding cassette, subfamily C (CFTR/MRP), member 1
VLLRFCVHSVLLALECCTKRPESNALKKHHGPEEIHGILSRVLLTWINPILLQGYQNILINQDMPHLRQDMKPEVTRMAMLSAWSRRG